ncbi:hypothetical protein IOC57_20345 [Bacillus sp. SD075]|uniref:hypothetical protein n=1 Tax=Bacillus sp. SD075 TaxID=2781732 RepID=UPI001A96402A|nr:hypothetical protein [Bacillus sp. SD075]
MTGGPIFPLNYPGIVSIPLGFLACYLGALFGNRWTGLKTVTKDNYNEILVKSNTGHDVKGVLRH